MILYKQNFRNKKISDCLRIHAWVVNLSRKTAKPLL